jgi:O-antigen/teichoic acid export membrane protein
MEMSFDFKAATDTAVSLFTQFGLKIIGAIAVWIVGRMLIREAFGEAGFAAPAQVHVVRNA